jgi:hypothetical protein
MEKQIDDSNGTGYLTLSRLSPLSNYLLVYILPARCHLCSFTAYFFCCPVGLSSYFVRLTDVALAKEGCGRLFAAYIMIIIIITAGPAGLVN